MEQDKFLENSKSFKILLLSNAQFCPSGYGNQTNGMINGWSKNYDCRVLANYGLQGRMLGLNGIQTYPCWPGDDFGAKTAQLIFPHWKPDVFVTLYDIWMGAFIQPGQTATGWQAIHPHWVPIVMVDHEPIPESTLAMAKEAYRIVVPNRYGLDQFTRNNVEASLIPFGIYTDNFKPSVDKKADRLWLRKNAVPFNANRNMPLEENSFVVFINGANKDPYRKDFNRMFIAVQLFLERHPEAARDLRVYVHSWMKQSRDIPHGAKVLNVDAYCCGTADYHNLCGVPDDAMARMYGAADVFLHLSQGGGFEIPILEALSCGVPVVAQDFVGIRELVEGRGWLVPPKTKYFTPLDALQAIGDEQKAADALEDAYLHPEKRLELGKKGREYALQFDWSIINPLWFKFFEEMRGEWQQKPLAERKL